MQIKCNTKKTFLIIVAILFNITTVCGSELNNVFRSIGHFSINDNKTDLSFLNNKNDKIFIHTVEKGETLNSILKKYRVSLDRFFKSNKRYAVSDLKLSLGQQLIFKKKDLNTATDLEIVRQINAYLKEWGIGKDENPVNSIQTDNGNDIKKSDADSIDPLSNVEKNKELRERGRLLDEQFRKIKRDPEFENSKDTVTSYDDNINVALLLPITRNGEIDKDYEAFYKGVLLAMDSLRRNGNIINLELIDTGRGMEVIEALVRNDYLNDKNIIIGPVFNEQFSAMADYAKEHSIAIVSPLASVKAANPYVFQVAPDVNTRYDKLKRFVLPDYNVIFFSTNNDDYAFVDKMREFSDKHDILENLPFIPDLSEEEIISRLSSDKNNVFVIGAKTKTDIELMVSKIYRIKSLYGARYNITIVGSGEFNKIDEPKRAEFFRTNVCYPVSYHQDRLNASCRAFETSYIDLFNELPNLFSYRGYDVTMLFINLMSEFGEEFLTYSEDNLLAVLQVNYCFIKDAETGKNINKEWMIVNYRPDFKIITR